MTKLVFQPIFDDDDTVKKDGQAMRVPMMMMDQRSQQLAAKTPVFDTRPKATFAADENVRRTARQADYDARVSASWQAPTTDTPRPAADAQAVYDKRVSDAWRTAR
jgi:hypothetical protein